MDDYIDSDSNTSFSPQPTSSPTDPYVRIIEQPAKCGVRFRYECEGRISGAIPGSTATTINPTYPTIKIFNYEGRAKVIVSCVTKNIPYRSHPHNLVGKKSCKDGVCIMIFNDMTCSFNNLGILCAKRKDIRERLKLRESLQIDPFGTGFGHKSQAFKIIDLAVVRLCFQVFLEGPNPDEFNIPLDPVVSDPIYDKKAMSELSISKLSHYSAPVTGGTEIVLLCDRVIKDDIQIRFYEERNDQLYWESYAEFKSNDIHKHFAISFRTPKYCDLSIQQPMSVNIQLKRPSDGGTSESLPFYMLPKTELTHKRQRINAFPYRNLKSVINQQKSMFTSYPNTIHTTPVTHVSEEIFVPRNIVSNTQQEYILPRLLGQHSYSHESHEQLPQTTDLIDFDMGMIEENDLNVIGNNSLVTCNINDQYWTNCDIVKDSINENECIDSADYMTVNSEENIELLDISGNTSIKQWSSGNSQKHFLCA